MLVKKHLLFVCLVFLVFLFSGSGISQAEVIKFVSEELKDTLMPEEYVGAVKFVFQVDKEKKVGEFWLTDQKNILSLAATYLRAQEIKDRKIPKDFKYRLIVNKGKAYDFVMFRENIPIFILNLNKKGEIILKPKTK
ncbi:MAG: hypothetical protein ACPL1D_02975, partial [Microgenomates group bacterium]